VRSCVPRKRNERLDRALFDLKAQGRSECEPGCRDCKPE
jgi:hypothetical protein